MRAATSNGEMLDAANVWSYLGDTNPWYYLAAILVLISNFLVHRPGKRSFAVLLLIPAYLSVALGMVIRFQSCFGVIGGPPYWPIVLDQMDPTYYLLFPRLYVILAGTIPVLAFGVRHLRWKFWPRNVLGFTPLILGWLDAFVLLACLRTLVREMASRNI